MADVFGRVDKWSDSTISVLVCDDGALGRRQLTVALEASDHIEVVAEADDADTALAEIIESTPDVVWLGLNLAGPGGVRMIASMTELVPSTRCVVMCGPDEGDSRTRALRAGAYGFVRREEAPSQAVAVTELVAWGHPYLAQRDLVALRDAFAAYSRQAGSVQQQLVPPSLDEPSTAVLEALAAGSTPGEAAESLGLTTATVEGAVANALALLHGHSRAETMAFAAEVTVAERG